MTIAPLPHVTQAQRIIAAETLKQYTMRFKDDPTDPVISFDLGIVSGKPNDMSHFSAMNSIRDALRYFAADERTQHPARVTDTFSRPDGSSTVGLETVDFKVDTRRMRSVMRFVDSPEYLNLPG